MKRRSTRIASERRNGVNRRTFLRGLGACVALPALESLSPVRLFGAETAPVAEKLAVTATGEAKLTCCQPLVDSLLKVAWASKLPPALHRLPTCVPVLVLPL